MKPILRIANVPGLQPARGPFSQGVEAEGRFLFVAGQGPYDSARGGFSREGIAEQTRLTLACFQRVLDEAGARREDVVSCRVFLQPLNSETFAAMNAVYAEFFGDHKPARTTIGAQLLDIDVEIDGIVRLP